VTGLPSKSTSATSSSTSAAARSDETSGQLYTVGWEVSQEQRQRLLAIFLPHYPKVVADHVTLASGVAADREPPPATDGEIVGQTDDGAGVQALVVRIGGTTDRPGGGTYHLTWSLGPGRRGIESNDVLAAGGWEPLQAAIRISLAPRRVPSSS
jgi:hypothetical protein